MRIMLGTLVITSVCRWSALQAEDQSPNILLWKADSKLVSQDQLGTLLPTRENEDPPALRMTNIQLPSMKRYDPPAGAANGVSLVIIPGGGYRYAVIGKEGAEIAKWLNSLGITAFVLSYRTPTAGTERDWLPPVQDAQRAIRLIRAQAAVWKLDPQRIGVIGFSAGGNAAAIASTNMQVPADRSPQDDVEKQSSRPNFTLLLYPWKLLNKDNSGLRAEVTVDQATPPTFLVHANDDGVTSLSSIEFYKAMKRFGLPAELHLYESGGHGYGLRPVANSNIHTWTDRARDWMQVQGLLEINPTR